MCDLYIQTNDLVAGYWFVGDLDAHIKEALARLILWKWMSRYEFDCKCEYEQECTYEFVCKTYS